MMLPERTSALPPNKGMEPTVKSVTPFAFAKAAPVLSAAHPQCYAAETATPVLQRVIILRRNDRASSLCVVARQALRGGGRTGRVSFRA